MQSFSLEKAGGIGFIVTAVFSPCCFPLLGMGLTALGYGSFELFGGWTMYVFEFFVLVTLAGLILSYRRSHFIYPLFMGIPGAALILTGYHFIEEDFWIWMLYSGMLLVSMAVVLNIYHRKRLLKKSGGIVLASTLTCPVCKHATVEVMPMNACRYFYECPNCRASLKPKGGDCCVFCSYGSVPCPPMQQGNNCCT